MARVLHTAQALVDIVLDVPHLPTTGLNVNATALPTAYAGGAVTIVVAAARTGATAVHGGSHGEGRNGDLIRSTLAEAGVQASAPIVQGKDSGSCYVLLEPSAERTFITCYGAERDISVDSLNTLRPAPGDLVCVSGYSLFEPTRDPLMTWLEALPPGVIVVLDPGAPFSEFPEPLRSRMLRLTNVWTSNADEARAITRTAAHTPAIETIPPLAALLPPQAVVVVRDGADGCYVLDSSEPDGESAGTVHYPGYPQTPVDTNGAGDTHTGILVAERALGRSWAQAAVRANAGAAMKVTRKGPGTSPTAREIDAFLASLQAPRR